MLLRCMRNDLRICIENNFVGQLKAEIHFDISGVVETRCQTDLKNNIIWRADG